jgi:hypothetical protein
MLSMAGYPKLDLFLPLVEDMFRQMNDGISFSNSRSEQKTFVGFVPEPETHFIVNDLKVNKHNDTSGFISHKRHTTFS